MNFLYSGVKLISSPKEKKSKTANAQFLYFHHFILMQSTDQVDNVKSGHMHIHYRTCAAPENSVSIYALEWRCLMLFMPMSNAFYGI